MIANIIRFLFVVAMQVDQSEEITTSEKEIQQRYVVTSVIK